nr:hypothetical protein [uncultured Moellerella sp.]
METRGHFITLMPYGEEMQQIEILAAGDAFHYQVEAVGAALMKEQQEIALPAAGLQDSFEIMQLLTQWEQLAKDFADKYSA